jgi:hypothetical protein
MNKTVRKIGITIQDEAGLNPKHEIRAKLPEGINSKQSQMTKFQIFQTREFRNFEFRKFEFVSDFDIRISDF